MLHLSTRTVLSPILLFPTLLTLNGIASAQQNPLSGPSATRLSGVATPAVKQPAAAGASVADRFLSQTTARLESADINKNIYHYVVTFPTKATANLTIALQFNQLYRPTAMDLSRRGDGIKIYGVSSSTDAASHSMTLKFFVPYSSLPPDAVKRLRSLMPTASTPDAAGAIVQSVGYRYFPVAFQSGGQEGAPSSSAAEVSGFWGTFAGEWLKGEVEPQVVQWFKNNLPFVRETGETLTGSLFAFLDYKEAATLNDVDSALLAQIMAYANCAHHPPASALPYMDLNARQARADQLVADAKIAIGYQFLVLMAKVAVPLASTPETGGLGILGNSFLAGAASTITDYLTQILQDELQEFGQLVPWCRGTWYGNFRVTGSAPVGTTYSDVGSIQFTVNGGQVTGVIQGTYHFSTVNPILDCSGESTYAGKLTGTAQTRLSNYVAAVNTWPAPTTFPLNGTMYPGKPCDMKGKPQAWALNIYLVDGQQTDYDPYNVPPEFAGATAALIQDGFKLHVTVTVRKLP